MSRTHLSKLAVLKLIVIFLMIPALGDNGVRAQDGAPSPTPTPKSAEVLRLEEEKTQAELRQAIAEANKAELEANFPKPTSSPLSGTTTINDNALIEGQMVAYVAMARAANKLVNAINRYPDLKVAKLAVFNEEDIRLLLSYKVANSQVDILRTGYCKLLSESVTKPEHCPRQSSGDAPPAPFNNPLSIAQSLVGSFVDLTSFFRTNVEIKGQVFDIDEAPLVAEVFRAARRRDGHGFMASAELYYPKMFAPDLNMDKKYGILGLLDALQNLRNTAGKLLADIEKNAEDIGKAETKVKNLELSIEQLEGQINEKKTKIANILKAYCPRHPAEGRDDPYGLSARLRRYCPGLDGEQRERVFELAGEIKDLGEQLTKAKDNLAKAKASLEKLETARAQLWQGLQAQPCGAANANDPELNALAIADTVAQLKARNEQVDKLIATLVQASAGGGPNALTSYIKAENLNEVLKEDTERKSYWLQLKVVKAGGNNRIKTNLIWDIFTGGNRVSHSGGVIVEYILYDTTGKSVASDTITEYTNYIKANKVRKLPTPSVDDCKPVMDKQSKVIGCADPQ
ncbi:MAG TPA: hypothetical protein VN256_05370 [Pyrinomonadaceae bacterium]|nr:hypothetical protein [Pyrinomonadaceae bacterium]